jgi:integrase
VGKNRSPGEGSIYLDQARGLWRGAVVMPDGRRRYLSGKSRADVAAKVRELSEALRKGEMPDGNRITVDELLGRWLEHARTRVRHHTYRGYDSVVREHLRPSIGRLRLTGLSPLHVERLMADLLGRGLAASSVLRTRRVLRAAINYGVRHDLVRRNAAALAEPPAIPPRKPSWLDASQATAFLAACNDDPAGPILATILLMGLRLGEAQGLRWGDYDQATATLTISRTIYRVKREWQETSPKTSAGHRRLPVPAPAAAIIARQWDTQVAAGVEPGPESPIFTSPRGGPCRVEAMHKGLTRLIAAAGLPRVTIHDLRHSTASILLEHRVPTRVVSELLGHANTAITLDIYSHVTRRLVEQAAEVMGGLAAPQKGNRADPVAADSAAQHQETNPQKPRQSNGS